MKFLHEMIAKKRQAQAELLDAKEHAGLAETFDLPEMSAVSPEAAPIPLSGTEDASASVIPIRQHQTDETSEHAEPLGNGFAAQSGGYDWNVSDIDLSEERASAGLDDEGDEAFEASAGDQVLDAAGDEAAHDTGRRAQMDLDDHLSASAPVQNDHAAEDPEDEPAHPASAIADLDEVGEEVLEEAAKPLVGEFAEADVAGTGEATEAEETDMTQSEDAAGEPAVRHKSAAEAAASLARQVQQRKIWDIQPPASESDAYDDEDVEASGVHEAETVTAAEVPTESTFLAEPANDEEHATRSGDIADADPEPELESVPIQSASVPNAEDLPEHHNAEDQEEAPFQEEAASETELSAEDTGLAETALNNEDEIDAPAPARRRTGRVKTRLLGFHKHEDESVDPISAASQSPAGQGQFPVGWVIVLHGPGRGASFTLTAGASKIGRGEDQAVRLDFGDNSISRDNHAVVAYDDEQRRFFIGHGGKANLVRLNDMPVLSTEPLTDGDTIRIGETTLLFVALCGPDFSWDDENVETAHAAGH